MDTETFAECVLLGRTLEEKLLIPQAIVDRPYRRIWSAPRVPGRPGSLSQSGRIAFPKSAQLSCPDHRARLIHFFANHELLALELMALHLLRFPEAPKAFRRTLLATMKDEQRHLMLYLARMRELGVDFGEHPVNFYFWNTLKDCRSPLDFVVHMNLTFEQANLDYSRYYLDQMKVVGDFETEKIFEIVLKDELNHVRHGLSWFEKWRDASKGQWEFYLEQLRHPMTAQRAKGKIFSERLRQQAGFSPKYIEALRMYQGSKGRPPAIWMFNADCEFEWAAWTRTEPRQRTHESSKRRLAAISDLQSVVSFLALPTDVVFVDKVPTQSWIEGVKQAGFALPKFVKDEGRLSLESSLREDKLSNICPWGWSPKIVERTCGLANQVVGESGQWTRRLLQNSASGLSELGASFSKFWDFEIYEDWRGAHQASAKAFGFAGAYSTRIDNWEGMTEQIRRNRNNGHDSVLKAPFGFSGNQNRILRTGDETSSEGWARRVIEHFGSVLVEPLLPRICDLSVLLQVESNRTRLVGIRQAIVDRAMQFSGMWLDRKLSQVSAEVRRWLWESPKGEKCSRVELLSEFAVSVGDKLRETGYQGPAGIDAFVWQSSNGYCLRPFVELNPRWTMGHVGLALEKQVAGNGFVVWRMFSKKQAEAHGSSLSELGNFLSREAPVRVETDGDKTRISEGVLCTNDPSFCQQFLTALFVGESGASAHSKVEATLKASPMSKSPIK